MKNERKEVQDERKESVEGGYLSGLPSGDYKIRIIVTDVPSGKKADLVVPISIRGKRE